MQYSLCKDLLNSNKIIYCFAERFLEYKKGKIDFNPWSVEIHPTAKCNHRCIHCSYEERNQSRSSIKPEIMEKLIESIINMNVKGVYFSGGGEPTLYPELNKYVKKLYENNVEVALLTNGTYMEESGLVEISNMFNYIALSVPSCEQEIFKKITGADFLKKVLDTPNKIKKLHKKNAPIIGSRIVITNLIYKEVPSILNSIKENNFDYALFKIVRDYEDRGLGLTRKEEEYLKNLINELKSDNKIDNNFTNLDNIFYFKKEIKFTDVCLTNQLGMIANINTDCTVYPNITEIGQNNFCIGDLNKNTLEEIWNSQRHLEVKNNSNEKWKNGKCKNCRAMGYNQIMNNIVFDIPKDLDAFI